MTTADDIIASIQTYTSNFEGQLSAAQAQIANLQKELQDATRPPLTREPYPAKGGPYGDLDPVGRLIINKAGAVVQGFDIPGWIEVRAPGVTITETTVRGANKGGTIWGAIFMMDKTAIGTHIQKTLVAVEYPQIQLSGIFGHDFTLDDVETMNTTDGVSIAGNNVEIKRLYAHDLVFWSPDPNHGRDAPPPGSHNDAVQISSGENIHIDESRLHSFYSYRFGDGWRTQANPNAQGGYNKMWTYKDAAKNYHGQGNSCLMTSGAKNVLVENSELLGGAMGINVAPGSPEAIKTRNVRYGSQIWAPFTPFNMVVTLA